MKEEEDGGKNIVFKFKLKHLKHITQTHTFAAHLRVEEFIFFSSTICIQTSFSIESSFESCFSFVSIYTYTYMRYACIGYISAIIVPQG